MEKIAGDLTADIVSLRESAARYRKLAEERKAQGHHLMGDAVLEFVTDLEAQVAHLEEMAKSASNDA